MWIEAEGVLNLLEVSRLLQVSTDEILRGRLEAAYA